MTIRTYEVVRTSPVLPDGSTAIDMIEADAFVHEGRHLVFYKEMLVLLSLHQDHVVSVRKIDEPEDSE